MKLTNRKNFMASLPEGSPPKSIKPKITQWIYFFILFMIIGYLLYIFVRQFYYFTEVGFVEVEKITISSSRGGRIKSLSVSVGDKLKKGQLLAILENHQDCVKAEDSRLDKLRYEITSNKAKLDTIYSEIKLNKDLIENDGMRRALELERGLLNNNEKIRLAIQYLYNQSQLLVKQLDFKKKQLKILIRAHSKLILSEECYDERIFYPFPSTVYSIQKQQFEVITRAESILTLTPENAPVRIDIYLSVKDYPSVSIGDLIDLEFPDGEKSSATITSILSSAYNRAERKLDQYRPVRTDILVLLKPLDEQQSKIWKKYDQMEVNVRGRR